MRNSPSSISDCPYDCPLASLQPILKRAAERQDGLLSPPVVCVMRAMGAAGVTMSLYPNIKAERLAHYVRDGRPGDILTSPGWGVGYEELGMSRDDLAQRVAVCALQCWHPSMGPPDGVATEQQESPGLEVDIRDTYL